MLFFGVQAPQTMPGLRGLGYSGGDYNSGDCREDNLADCLQCCDASFDPSTDQDGSTACQIDCAQSYPSSAGTSSGSSGGGSSSGKSSGNANASSQPWYSAIFGSVAQGITTGALHPGTTTPVVAQPWYTTPGGMGVIAIALIGFAVLLAKR